MSELSFNWPFYCLNTKKHTGHKGLASLDFETRVEPLQVRLFNASSLFGPWKAWSSVQWIFFTCDMQVMQLWCNWCTFDAVEFVFALIHIANWLAGQVKAAQLPNWIGELEKNSEKKCIQVSLSLSPKFAMQCPTQFDWLVIILVNESIMHTFF